jgi:ABC-type branched-subunit amino acid transport system ATPase component
MSTDSAVLEVNNLDVSYGDSRVLFGVTVNIAPKEIVSCVGRNGAGKTTLLKSICGFLKPTSGSVTYKAQEITGVPSYTLARMGLRYIAQDKKVFSDLTVAENMELASYATKDKNLDRIFEYFPNLKSLMNRKAGYLSGGEKQMLMIGRALLGTPSVLLIDEPTEGLAPVVVEHLREIFKEISKSAALIIVEQNLSLVCRISDRVYAMKEGQVMSETSDEQEIKDIVFEKYL